MRAAESEEEEIGDAISRTRLWAILCLVGFAAFVALDWMVAKEAAWKMLQVRAATEVAVGLGLGTTFTPWGRHNTKITALYLFLTSCLSLIVLTSLAGGAASQYHQFIALMYVCYAALMPTTTLLAFIALSGVTVVYAATLMALGLGGTSIQFVSNLSFLLLAAVIGLFYIRADERLKERVVAGRRLRQEYLELARTAEELTRLDRMKSEFYANINHELRTPLTMVLAHAELAEIEAAAAADRQPGLMKHLQACRRSGAKLHALVTDMWELTCLEMGKMRLEYAPTNIFALAESSVRDLGELAAHKGIRLTFRPPEGVSQLAPGALVVDADPRQVERILINLLTNAIKFTEAGGDIVVEVRSAADGVCFLVGDTGRGIAAKALPKIFDRGFQERGLDDTGGLGIGLFLVRQVVQAHGGRAEVVSEPGVGTIFLISLPARAPGSRP